MIFSIVVIPATLRPLRLYDASAVAQLQDGSGVLTLRYLKGSFGDADIIGGGDVRNPVVVPVHFVDLEIEFPNCTFDHSGLLLKGAPMERDLFLLRFRRKAHMGTK